LGDLSADCLSQAQWLFAQTPAVKKSMETESSRRGWFRFDSSAGASGWLSAALDVSHTPFACVDSIEAFNMGRELDSPLPLREPYFRELYGSATSNTTSTARGVKQPGAGAARLKPAAEPWRAEASRRNAWPRSDDPARDAAFRTTMLRCFDACVTTSSALLRALVDDLGLPETLLDNAHSRQDHSFELKLYPRLRLPQSGAAQEARAISVDATADARTMRIPEHADLSSLTLLIQDEVDRAVPVWLVLPTDWACGWLT
jgi:isopenicillin N synthase-like dioxygenase